MANSNLKIHLADAEATASLASILAQNVQSGDTVLLLGEVGAGKTHFARSFIKSLLTVDEDVPSPTFTLVQTYDTVIGEVWHSDLYRLSAEQEIEELGLFDAMIEAVCLIEWPDRLGSYTPTDALHIELTPSSTLDSRVLIAQWDDPKWDAKTKGWRND
jgi:tRNA threonylcarbamoyladenosine biosynthesis protein TsaE